MYVTPSVKRAFTACQTASLVRLRVTYQGVVDAGHGTVDLDSSVDTGQNLHYLKVP